MVLITQQKIQPPSKRIFVFGSNLAGRHGAGAALHARIHYNAQLGCAEGRTGQSYALPTKDQNLKSLPLEDIELHVESFLAYAKANINTEFNVTQIGCGFAGYRSFQIAPMFENATSNCWFDPDWRTLLGNKNFWEKGTT